MQAAQLDKANAGKKFAPVVEWPVGQKTFTIRNLGQDGSAGVRVTLKL